MDEATKEAIETLKALLTSADDSIRLQAATQILRHQQMMTR